MQILINIPEHIYEHAVGRSEDSNDEWDAMRAIANGVVLPKGHGTLKDTDAICKDIISALGIRDENYLLEAEKAIYKRIKNAPAIIEADKGSEDK